MSLPAANANANANANTKVVILRLVMLVAIVALPAAILNVPRFYCASDALEDAPSAETLDSVEQLRRQRIISYSPSVTDIVVDLGLLDNLVGVTSWCILPQGASVAKVGSESTLNSEALLALEPDVIFIQQTKDRFLPLMKMRPDLKVISVSHDSIEGIGGSIRTIADTMGYSARGDELAKRLARRIEQIRQRCSRKNKPRVLFLIGYDHPGTCGRDTYLDEVIGVVGGVNAAAENYKGWPSINAEMIVKLKPDVIVCQVNAGQEQAARDYFMTLKHVPAISRGRLHITSNRHLTFFSSRIVADVILPFEKYVHGAAKMGTGPNGTAVCFFGRSGRRSGGVLAGGQPRVLSRRSPRIRLSILPAAKGWGEKLGCELTRTIETGVIRFEAQSNAKTSLATPFGVLVNGGRDPGVPCLPPAGKTVTPRLTAHRTFRLRLRLRRDKLGPNNKKRPKTTKTDGSAIGPASHGGQSQNRYSPRFCSKKVGSDD